MCPFMFSGCTKLQLPASSSLAELGGKSWDQKRTCAERTEPSRKVIKTEKEKHGKRTIMENYNFFPCVSFQLELEGNKNGL
jgi:hypothetical protein